MRFEGNDRRNCARGARPFDYGLHDELMAEMQPIKHAKRQDSGARDVGILCSVE